MFVVYRPINPASLIIKPETRVLTGIYFGSSLNSLDPSLFTILWPLKSLENNHKKDKRNKKDYDDYDSSFQSFFLATGVNVTHFLVQNSCERLS